MHNSLLGLTGPATHGPFSVALLMLAALIIGVATTKAQDLPAEIPAGVPPEMMTEGQKPTPHGGRVILFSRSRHGNYPLASYTFSRGLRGDDKTAGNAVDLVFGNVQRENAFRGRRVDTVPGVNNNGAAGMDGGGAGAKDQFRVGLVGGADHRIVDLGKIDFDGLTNIPLPAKNSRAKRVDVQRDHVYMLRLFGRGDGNPIYVKLRVLQHRDNDAVLFEWKPIEG